MSSNIVEAAYILMYKGPAIGELLASIVNGGEKFEIFRENSMTIISAISNQPYNLQVEDKYYYDLSGELVKQVVIIDGNEKTIFDKFNEALELIKMENKLQVI